jgi:Flp pilus assembly protein TadB
MKFLSLFTKAPQHQRFKYAPRYYDPIKEELEERESRIKQELARERGEQLENSKHRSRIAGSFHAARKRSKGGPGTSATMIRLGIILFMVVFFIAYLEFGRPVLYSLFAVIPIYFYFRFKNRQ